MPIADINRQTALEMTSDPSCIWVDVREAAEFVDFNMGGINIPPHLVADQLKRLKSYDKILLICADGFRSGLVAKYLEKRLPSQQIYHIIDGLL